MSIVLTGLLLVPAPAHAGSKASNLCPHDEGQYYRPIHPFFDYRKRQVALVERNTYRVVQVLADHVDEMYFFGYDAWSPSCRYFAFAIGPWSGNETVIWDTVEQKQVGTFHRKTFKGLHILNWGDSDNFVIVGTIVGQFLWKIPSNEQIQMNDHDRWAYYLWDTPRTQVFTFDGRYVVAYTLITGTAVRKYISPFQQNLTDFDLSPDGKTLTIRDKYYYMWSVTFDRSTGAVIDAKAEPGRRPEEVQISPDRRYLVIGGYGISIYDVSDVSKPDLRWWQYAYIEAGNYTWRFADASTLELTYKKDGKHRLYDLNTKKFR